MSGPSYWYSPWYKLRVFQELTVYNCFDSNGCSLYSAYFSDQNDTLLFKIGESVAKLCHFLSIIFSFIHYLTNRSKVIPLTL